MVVDFLSHKSKSLNFTPHSKCCWTKSLRKLKVQALFCAVRKSSSKLTRQSLYTFSLWTIFCFQNSPSYKYLRTTLFFQSIFWLISEWRGMCAKEGFHNTNRQYFAFKICFLRHVCIHEWIFNIFWINPILTSILSQI